MEPSLRPLELPPEILPPAWHGATAPPLEIDVGCHKGLFLVEMARMYPSRNFLGVELQGERVEKTRKKIRSHNLQNALVSRMEGLDAIRALPEACVDFIHVLFPDPWPKRRHHVRRLVQEAFLKASLRALKADGVLRLVTDDPDYAMAMVETVENFPAFAPTEDLREYPLTEFQKKFLIDARAVHTLVVTRAE